jgi:hypothetical protein
MPQTKEQDGYLRSMAIGFSNEVRHRNGPLWIVRAAKEIKGRMSGSPIVDDKCSAIAVLCAIGGISGEQNREGGPNPRLARNLPGWLLQNFIAEHHGKAAASSATDNL